MPFPRDAKSSAKKSSEIFSSTLDSEAKSIGYCSALRLSITCFKTLPAKITNIKLRYTVNVILSDIN